MDSIQLRKDHLELAGYDKVSIERIVESLSVFLLSSELTQITFGFSSGVQAGVFFNMIEQIKNGGVFLFKDREGRTKACDLVFVKDWNLLLKSYMCIKDTTKVVCSFYKDEENDNYGYLTFIKGDRYEA